MNKCYVSVVFAICFVSSGVVLCFSAVFYVFSIKEPIGAIRIMKAVVPKDGSARLVTGYDKPRRVHASCMVRIMAGKSWF